MSKRYRNGFKRTLCSWTIPTPLTSYRNVRSNGYHNNNSPLSPTLVCTNNLRHHRLTYSNNDEKSEKMNNSFFRHRDNVFTFSMSKYKLVIGSRTHTSHTGMPGRYNRQASFPYHFSAGEQQDREQQLQQLQQPTQLQQRKFSTNVKQQKRQPPKLIFRSALPPLISPHSLISESKTFTHMPNGTRSKH